MRNIFENIKYLPNNISEVVCGICNTFIRSTNGKILACGDNFCGQYCVMDVIRMVN